jgi:hypothetical protein
MAETNQKKVNHKKNIASGKKAQRRAEAEERKAKRDAMTVAQRIKELDMLFGVGLGAVNERKRLLNPKPAPVKKEEPKAETVAESVKE